MKRKQIKIEDLKEGEIYLQEDSGSDFFLVQLIRVHYNRIREEKSLSLSNNEFLEAEKYYPSNIFEWYKPTKKELKLYNKALIENGLKPIKINKDKSTRIKELENKVDALWSFMVEIQEKDNFLEFLLAEENKICSTNYYETKHLLKRIINKYNELKG